MDNTLYAYMLFSMMTAGKLYTMFVPVVKEYAENTNSLMTVRASEIIYSPYRKQKYVRGCRSAPIGSDLLALCYMKIAVLRD